MAPPDDIDPSGSSIIEKKTKKLQEPISRITKPPKPEKKATRDERIKELIIGVDDALESCNGVSKIGGNFSEYYAGVAGTKVLFFIKYTPDQQKEAIKKLDESNKQIQQLANQISELKKKLADKEFISCLTEEDLEKLEKELVKKQETFAEFSQAQAKSLYVLASILGPKEKSGTKASNTAASQTLEYPKVKIALSENSKQRPLSFEVRYSAKDVLKFEVPKDKQIGSVMELAGIMKELSVAISKDNEKKEKEKEERREERQKMGELLRALIAEYRLFNPNIDTHFLSSPAELRSIVARLAVEEAARHSK